MRDFQQVHQQCSITRTNTKFLFSLACTIIETLKKYFRFIKHVGTDIKSCTTHIRKCRKLIHSVDVENLPKFHLWRPSCCCTDVSRRQLQDVCRSSYLWQLIFLNSHSYPVVWCVINLEKGRGVVILCNAGNDEHCLVRLQGVQGPATFERLYF